MFEGARISTGLESALCRECSSLLGISQYTVVIEQNPQIIAGTPCAEKTVVWVKEGNGKHQGHVSVSSVHLLEDMIRVVSH